MTAALPPARPVRLERPRHGWRTLGASIAFAALLATATSACSEPLPDPADEAASVESPCVEDLLACARESMIAELVPEAPTAADPEAEPIRLGLVNQENTAAGSYPELSLAALAATEFINGELGGVDGRPIEIEVCNTEFSAEGSTSCGQRFVEAEVDAVLGGIDVFGNAVSTLEDNAIPYIGGIPISERSVESTTSFQWSGGGWGTAVAFASFAAEELDAERVSIVFADFGAITHSAEMAEAVLDHHGVQTQLVPYPVMATDLTPALNAAAGADPDAVFILAADAACKASFDGLAALDLDAARFFSGACAAPTIIEQAGMDAVEGTYFNVESPIGDDPADPDMALYGGVIEAYGDGLDPVGAGTVTFKAVMNLYAILHQLDGSISPASITEALRSTADEPSFGGHPYTCDGGQFTGLPAICSPQQILIQMRDGELEQTTDWIDVGAIYAATR
jgi:branched-chain amino acid transport system substrate-binding protein